MDAKLRSYLKEWRDLQHKRRKKRITTMVIFNNVVLNWWPPYNVPEVRNEVTVEINRQAILIRFIRDPHLHTIMIERHDIQNFEDQGNRLFIFFWNRPPYRFEFLSNEEATQFNNLIRLLMGHESNSGNSTGSSTTATSTSSSSSSAE